MALQGTDGRAAELKAQGALEASRDPNSGVDARAAEETMMNQAKAGGAQAFEFDPDATPEQKKAQMQAVCRMVEHALTMLTPIIASTSRKTNQEASGRYAGQRSRRWPNSWLRSTTSEQSWSYYGTHR